MNTRVCDSGQLMPVDEAIEQLLAQAPPAPPTEVIPLGQAAGRVIAEELFSPLDLPCWDNSAMDGYALRAADVPEQGGYLVLAGRIAAGHSSDELLQAGQTVRIFSRCTAAARRRQRGAPGALPRLRPAYLVPAAAPGRTRAQAR